MRAIAPTLLVGAGWYGGAKYGAPELLIRAADGLLARGQAMVAPLIGRGGELAAGAAQQGGEYVVGTVEQMLEDLADNEEADETEETAGDEAESGEAAETGAAAPTQPAAAPAPPVAADEDGAIILCPKMRISNAPAAGAGGVVRPAGAAIKYKGVELTLMPATQACLSSGYGLRGGKLHRGVDYYTKSGGDVLAAGAGVIIEAVTRDDYGNMIVIDHGGGVFTRYAHLARFAGGVKKGANVARGQRLGPIGQTGASSIVHLHWEVLTGEYTARAGSFGLESVDPFSLPKAKPGA